LRENLPPRVGDETFPIWTRYWPAAQSMLLPDCILDGKPQRIRSLLAMGINTAMWPNSKRMEEALGALDFFAASDFFHNPATRMADIVLPAATNLERPALIAYPGCAYQGELRYRRAAVAPKGEARPDGEVFLELGVRLGMGEQFWNGDLEASWAEAAEGIPDEIRGGLQQPRRRDRLRQGHRRPGRDGYWTRTALYRLRGFKTAHRQGGVRQRRVANAIGHDGLPSTRSPPRARVSTPELAGLSAGPHQRRPQQAP
jgi:anaerobic selenocysteine-containing dehydrogenase